MCAQDKVRSKSGRAWWATLIILVLGRWKLVISEFEASSFGADVGAVGQCQSQLQHVTSGSGVMRSKVLCFSHSGPLVSFFLVFKTGSHCSPC